MKRSVILGDSFPDVALHYLTSLIKRREYANVVKYYEDNRSEFAAFGGTRAAESLHLVSQAYASVNNHPSALRIARLAQQKAVEDGDSILLAEIFATIGSVLIRLGEYKEAEKAYRDAESIFRRNDQLEGQCRALNQLSGLFFRQNDYQNSLAILTDALNIAHQLGDTKKIAYMMGNLGRLNTFLGDFPEATRHLQLNIDVSTELNDWLEVGRAYLSLAYVHIQTGEYQSAEEKLQKAKEFLSKQKSERDDIIYLTYLGELYRHMGRLSESESILRTALQLAEEIAPGTTLAGRAMRHLAELYVIEQKFQVAGRMAAKSMTIMQKAADRVECGALYKLKAVIADNSKDKAACQKFFNLSINLLSDSGVRFEKTDALVKAGISEAFSKRKRLMFLFRAEEFYARYRIAPQLDKVGALIQELGDVGSGRAASKPARNSVESEFLTNSSDIKRFMSQLSIIGKMDLTILLTGETGVGKDHLARYYHSQVRPDGPFVAINCASVP
ncbi:MAG: tetratricopeptide repeat protein, partial [candidate division Zixibacteria bacterium]